MAYFTAPTASVTTQGSGFYYNDALINSYYKQDLQSQYGSTLQYSYNVVCIFNGFRETFAFTYSVFRDVFYNSLPS